jgi:Spy/CpxP family protein refolding chaperone
MRHYLHQALAALCVAGLAATTATAAAAQNRGGAQPGDVVQSIPPPVSQNPQLPKLNLTDAQRAKIKQVLQTKDTEVDFQLKSNKSAQSFQPAVGAAVPPALKRYTYLKFKGQVLIVNPMNRKIVDMFAET